MEKHRVALRLGAGFHRTYGARAVRLREQGRADAWGETLVLYSYYSALVSCELNLGVFAWAIGGHAPVAAVGASGLFACRGRQLTAGSCFLMVMKLMIRTKVDLIMGMANPTGSVRLILHHTFATRKWKATTVVTLIYLVYNIVGRLCVAGFGVTYDVNEIVSFPVLITDWSSLDWFDVNSGWLDGTEVTDSGLTGPTAGRCGNVIVTALD